jgi:hypothetical protein
MARSGVRSLRERRVARPLIRGAVDLVDDDGAVATLRPTPAHADQALALSDAFGERFGRGAHRAIAFEVGHVFGAEALDDIVAGGGVGGIVENERIAEDSVSAVVCRRRFRRGRACRARRRACCRGGWNRGLSWRALLEVGVAGGLAIPPAGRRAGGREESVSDRDPRGRRPVTGFASGGKPRVERGPEGGRPTSEASPSSGGELGVSPMPHESLRFRRHHSRDRRAGRAFAQCSLRPNRNRSRASSLASSFR